MITLHIGFDDTDSLRGGCTTYIAALLVEKLHSLGAAFTDYPNLIRLNPNVPWKTRGNGALCLRVMCNEHVVDEILETVSYVVEEHSDLGFAGTDPGVVFFWGAEIPREIKAFAKATIQSVVRMQDAVKLVRKFKAEALGFGSGRGIIGALASIGETLDGDHTFEAIAYRTPEKRGSPRKLDLKSVRKMNKETWPNTFNNVDSATGRVLITPRGPDPVLYAVRGETAEAVIQAHKMVEALEPLERWVVFRTNHGTDAHLKRVESLNQIKPFHPVIVSGAVVSPPKLIPKRHRVFSIADKTGEVDCAAFEPTGILRKVVRQLEVGDLVEAYGGVKPASAKHPTTINLEKLRILDLAPKLAVQNPKCPECGKRLTSMGSRKGFKCGKCGFRTLNTEKTFVEQKRYVKKGLYITSPRSQRHLTKPLVRYGKEKHLHTKHVRELDLPFCK